MFRRNVGGVDRVLRVTFGAILALAGLVLLTGKTSLALILTVVGVLALVTGIARFCILYIPLGISTARSKEPHEGYVCDCMAPLTEARPGADGSPVVTAKEDDGVVLPVT
jgi:Inner membrane protein YgaP-like, transmembrane domain